MGHTELERAQKILDGLAAEDADNIDPQARHSNIAPTPSSRTAHSVCRDRVVAPAKPSRLVPALHAQNHAKPNASSESKRAATLPSGQPSNVSIYQDADLTEEYSNSPSINMGLIIYFVLREVYHDSDNFEVSIDDKKRSGIAKTVNILKATVRNFIC